LSIEPITSLDRFTLPFAFLLARKRARLFIGWDMHFHLKQYSTDTDRVLSRMGSPLLMLHGSISFTLNPDISAIRSTTARWEVLFGTRCDRFDLAGAWTP